MRPKMIFCLKHILGLRYLWEKQALIHQQSPILTQKYRCPSSKQTILQENHTHLTSQSLTQSLWAENTVGHMAYLLLSPVAGQQSSSFFFLCSFDRFFVNLFFLLNLDLLQHLSDSFSACALVKKNTCDEHQPVSVLDLSEEMQWTSGDASFIPNPDEDAEEDDGVLLQVN